MDFKKYTQKGEIIVNEVAEELGVPQNKKLAGRILREVLHTLRSRLTIQESFQLIAQLPLVIKALYMENWKYTEKPKRIKHIDDFVTEVAREDTARGRHDIPTMKDGENAVKAVLRVLRRHVSEGEIQHILQSMPPDLRPLWGEPNPV